MLKKTFLFGVAAIALASCTNSDPLRITTGLSENVHIVAKDGTVTTGTAAFNVVYDFDGPTGELAVSNLMLGVENTSFTCNPVKAEMFQTALREVFMWKPTSVKESNITDFSNAYTLFCNSLAIYPTPFPGILTNVTRHFIFAGFTVNGYTVKSFPTQTYYIGNFTSTMPGASAKFTTEDPYVAVNMDLNQMKASVTIYEAQFASPMPKVNMSFEGLDINLTKQGYVISGTDIVPNQLEGSNKTPNPTYTISNFNLTNQSKDLTTISLEFTLTNGAKAEFYGANSGASVM